MEIRGRRECTDCGQQWSYYETGSVTCPACGSVESVGLDDERTLHTASPRALDLTAVRASLDESPWDEVLEETKATCRTYVREQGFVVAGALQPLDDTALAARELAQVADVVDRSTRLADDAERYLLTLLRGAADAERPEADAVPAVLRAARGLAAAEGVRDYLRELRTWRETVPDEAGSEMRAGEASDRDRVDELVERLDDHARRVRALQGDVPPAEAAGLVAATRAVSRALSEGDAEALDSAEDHLAALD